MACDLDDPRLLGFAFYTLALIRPLMEIFEITRDGLKKHKLA